MSGNRGRPVLPKPDQKTAVVRRGSGVRPQFSSEARQWWLLPPDKLPAAVCQLVARIDDNNCDLRERFLRYARMYGNYDALGLTSFAAGDGQWQGSYNQPSYNIIQSSVDTVMSKIVRDNPAPYFITSGADYFDKVKAEKMTHFCQGLFQQMGFYEIANNKVFRDAAVYGLGGVVFKYSDRLKRIVCEWMFIDELKVDAYDGQKQKPRSLHRCYPVQKEVLISDYPDSEEVIDDIGSAHPELFRTKETVIDEVIITESWHLPSGKRSPGRHTVILADEILLDEPYDEDFFPIAFFQYYQKPIGFYGRGVPETIQSGQIEINKILHFIQQCQELQASPLILVDSSSEVSNESILTNGISRIVNYRSGSDPPTFVTPQAAGPEIYQHLQNHMNWCREEVGITLTSQQGQKQPGIDSAVALRAQVDIESGRFIQVSKNWERFFVDSAEICVRLARRISKDDSDFSVRYEDKRRKVLRTIRFRDISLPVEGYTVQCQTVSAMPATAAGRIQTITDFIGNGWISQERGMDLLQIDPDLEDETKLRTSSLHLVEKRLCEMVEEKLYTHPEPYLNLQLALTVSVATYNQLCIDECPDDRLQLVRNWIGEITSLQGGTDPLAALAAQVQPIFQSGGPAAPTAPQAGLAAA